MAKLIDSLEPLEEQDPVYTASFLKGPDHLPFFKGAFWGILIGVVFWALVLLAFCGCSPALYSTGCAALDVATTCYALENGFTEVNPIYPDDYACVTGALVAAGVQYALKKWNKPNAFWGYGSVRCAAGLWNLNQLREE